MLAIAYRTGLISLSLLAAIAGGLFAMDLHRGIDPNGLVLSISLTAIKILLVVFLACGFILWAWSCRILFDGRKKREFFRNLQLFFAMIFFISIAGYVVYYAQNKKRLRIMA